jgi:hypothetical protein
MFRSNPNNSDYLAQHLGHPCRILLRDPRAIPPRDVGRRDSGKVIGTRHPYFGFVHFVPARSMYHGGGTQKGVGFETASEAPSIVIFRDKWRAFFGAI